MGDWSDEIERLIQDEEFIVEFSDSVEYFDAFVDWINRKHPEELGND